MTLQTREEADTFAAGLYDRWVARMGIPQGDPTPDAVIIDTPAPRLPTLADCRAYIRRYYFRRIAEANARLNALATGEQS